MDYQLKRKIHRFQKFWFFMCFYVFLCLFNGFSCFLLFLFSWQSIRVLPGTSILKVLAKRAVLPRRANICKIIKNIHKYTKTYKKTFSAVFWSGVVGGLPLLIREAGFVSCAPGGFWLVGGDENDTWSTAQCRLKCKFLNLSW